ncbi:MAG: hypothetical protein H6865_03685 [Rhodospirillales bacterium]|nr:hypothetical protein [Alphaproteobacteria bacterium]MCB9986719.1 hypothetical protein [Rhodospirillales bacterium]USO08511.1 MAG: hypothetical protein H6866_04700 [Rhodospirillales bacterium]
MRLFALILLVAVVPFAAGCKQEKKQEAQDATSAPYGVDAPQGQTSAPSAPARVADGWSGRWIGPGDSYLIVQNEDGYTVTIADQSGLNQYPARPTKAGMEFLRAGKIESLNSGSGADTGVKELARQRSCLIVKPGEGYCRE